LMIYLNFLLLCFFFFFQAEDGIRDRNVTGVQTCALPIYILTMMICWFSYFFPMFNDKLLSILIFFNKKSITLRNRHCPKAKNIVRLQCFSHFFISKQSIISSNYMRLAMISCS